MSAEPSRESRRLVESLLYLPSESEIRAAVLANRALSHDELRSAFEAVSHELEEEGRAEERELLDYIRGLVADLVEPPPDDPGAVPDIADGEALLRAARRRPDTLHTRTLFAAHRDLLTPDFLQDTLAQVVEPDVPFPERQRRLNLAWTAARVAGNPASLIEAELLRVAILRDGGRHRQAEHRLERLREQAERLADGSLLLKVLGSQVGLYRARCDLPKALEALEAMLEQAQCAGLGDTYQISIRKGIASCARDLGQFAKALDQLNAVLPMVTHTGAAELVVPVLVHRGLVQEDMGRYDHGFLDYERANALARQIDDRGWQFETLNNMAASFAKRGLDREAYRRYRDVLQTVERWGNPMAVASTHNNLGLILLDLGRPADALTEYRKAIQDKINTGTEGEVLTMLGMGDALVALGRHDEAKTWYTLALIPCLERGDASSITMVATRWAALKDEDRPSRIHHLQWRLTAPAHRTTGGASCWRPASWAISSPKGGGRPGAGAAWRHALPRGRAPPLQRQSPVYRARVRRAAGAATRRAGGGARAAEQSAWGDRAEPG